MLLRWDAHLLCRSENCPPIAFCIWGTSSITFVLVDKVISGFIMRKYQELKMIQQGIKH